MSSSMVSLQSGEPVVVSSPMVGTAAVANPLTLASTAVLFPNLVALINQAVQEAVEALQRQQPPAIVCSTSCSGAGSSSSSLTGLASFLAAGTGFQPSILSSSTQSKTIPLVLPTFVSTFNMPVLALVLSSGHALSGISAQLPSSNVNSLVDQLFIVGLGFSPVPAKLVSQIRSGKFVNLSELLASNLVTPPSLSLNRCSMSI